MLIKYQKGSLVVQGGELVHVVEILFLSNITFIVDKNKPIAR